ncbi:MAG TPA: phosphate signaling complex protein PhoU [Gemmataceae bacterium]|jgi:phosphate transport system protein|nr:phosphate signaling complex protein PhoU [Gemmataceae bacterium]
MAKHLQRDLDELQRDLLALASLVEGQVHKAIRALQDRDPRLAQEVIAGDPQVDLEENHIDEECLKILALHQPVAVDLRRTAAVLMITTDLERVGDLAEEIAERAVHLARPPHLPVSDKLQRMTDLTTMMVRQSLDAFVNLDTTLAQTVIRMDDEVDRYNVQIIDEITQAMKGSPALIDPGLSMFSAVRHLERIADHATNIAEDVIYLVEGEIVRHKVSPGNAAYQPR